MRFKLTPDDLAVSSFETAPAAPRASEIAGTMLDCPTDPTPATWCRICPPYDQEQ